MTDDRYPSAALHAMALVASLRTALGVTRAIEARRGGHDPAAQEPEAPVRRYLSEAIGRLKSILVRLRLRVAASIPGDVHAALVQTFEDRLTLADLAEELRVLHQKLLSLYPAVSESVIEAIRVRYGEALHLLEADELDHELALFTERVATVLEALQERL